MPRPSSAGLREDREEVGDAAVRDPDLLAVQDPVVAVAHGRRLDRRRVGAGARLGEAERGDHLARRELRQEARASARRCRTAAGRACRSSCARRPSPRPTRRTRPTSCTRASRPRCRSPRPPCSSGMTRPKSPASRSSSMNSAAARPSLSQARNSFSRPPSIAFERREDAPSVSFSPGCGSGNGRMISSSICAHAERPHEARVALVHHGSLLGLADWEVITHCAMKAQGRAASSTQARNDRPSERTIEP